MGNGDEAKDRHRHFQPFELAVMDRLGRVERLVERHEFLLVGDLRNPGITTIIDRLSNQMKALTWWLRVIATGVMGWLVVGLLDLLKQQQ